MRASSLDSCQEWYIYNSQTQEQLGPINTKELRDLLMSMDSLSQTTSLVWCPFWKDWRKGNEALANIGNLASKRSATPPPLNKKLLAKAAEAAADSSPIYPVERKFPRIEGTLNVTLLSKGRCYRTRTKTLSMGGMGFVSTVPKELFAPNCKAVLSSANASHGIVASLQDTATKDPSGAIKCVRFEELRGSALTTYVDWLKAFNKEPIAA